MDIQFYGANAFVLSNKNARIVIDDNLEELGAKSIVRKGDIVLSTGTHTPLPAEAGLVIDYPGEYEVKNVSVYGLQLRAHIDEQKQKSVVAYKVIMDDVRIFITGHIYPELSERELEAIGTVDVLIVPAGGNGYTVDPVGALKLFKKIDPKMVILSHYDDDALNYPVPQQPLSAALIALGMEPKITTDKLKIKSSELPEARELVVLERSN